MEDEGADGDSKVRGAGGVDAKGGASGRPGSHLARPTRARGKTSTRNYVRPELRGGRGEVVGEPQPRHSAGSAAAAPGSVPGMRSVCASTTPSTGSSSPSRRRPWDRVGGMFGVCESGGLGADCRW